MHQYHVSRQIDVKYYTCMCAQWTEITGDCIDANLNAQVRTTQKERYFFIELFSYIQNDTIMINRILKTFCKKIDNIGDGV